MISFLFFLKPSDGSVIFLTGLLIFWFSLPAAQSQNTVDGPKYSKILVLAKVQEPEIEKSFENEVVSALKNKGYIAIPSYSSFTPAELENTDRLVAKADSLGIDALLAFTLKNVETTVVNTPQVSASVGVPVRIGFFSVFVGGSVPLGGGPKEESTVHVLSAFYNDRNSEEPAWQMPLSGSLSYGTETLINDFTRKSIKALFKQKILEKQ